MSDSAIFLPRCLSVSSFLSGVVFRLKENPDRTLRLAIAPDEFKKRRTFFLGLGISFDFVIESVESLSQLEDEGLFAGGHTVTLVVKKWRDLGQVIRAVCKLPVKKVYLDFPKKRRYDDDRFSLIEIFWIVRLLKKEFNLISFSPHYAMAFTNAQNSEKSLKEYEFLTTFDHQKFQFGLRNKHRELASMSGFILYLSDGVLSKVGRVVMKSWYFLEFQFNKRVKRFLLLK